MIATALPDIGKKASQQADPAGNKIIFADTNCNYYYPRHSTPYLFITNFINKGSYILNNKNIEVSDKLFYFLNANDTLEIHFSKPVRRKTLFILFDEKFVVDSFNYLQRIEDEKLDTTPATIPGECNLPNVPFDLNEQIREKIPFLLSHKNNEDDIDNILFEMIGEVWKLHLQTLSKFKRINAVKRSTKEELYRRLIMAKEFMIDNLSQNLKIEEIAKEVNLDKFHFLSNFKDLFNTTPHQFLIEIKLQRALHLLQSKKYSVSEVCFQVGFESTGSFSNLFKKRFKRSPSSFTA